MNALRNSIVFTPRRDQAKGRTICYDLLLRGRGWAGEEFMPSVKRKNLASERLAFAPPPSVIAWTAGTLLVVEVSGASVSLSTGPRASLASVRIDGARAMGPSVLADHVTRAYQAIESTVAATDHAHVVRWWNGIPGIHDRVDAARDRYMAFNAGRFAAMRRRYGDANLVDEAPAASGVGINGDALVIHALAAASPGRSIQNPRQRPAVRYSSRFGPLPPCFARATLSDAVDGAPTLLISGTAAILGEETVHVGDLAGQLAVTIDHLRKLISGAGWIADGPAADATSVRAYLPNIEDAQGVAAPLASEFPTAAIELVPAELCRQDLLVEIECIVTTSPSRSGA